MRIKKCDRCGKEILIGSNPLSQVILPLYTIHKSIGMGLLTTEIDLCDECEEKLSKWLCNGKESESDV